METWDVKMYIRRSEGEGCDMTRSILAEDDVVDIQSKRAVEGQIEESRNILPFSHSSIHGTSGPMGQEGFPSPQ